MQPNENRHKTVDKLFMNGTILTAAGQPKADFVAVSGNRIVETGTKPGNHLTGRNTELIDLRGKYMMPGFIDSHLHLFDYAASVERIDLNPCKSQSEVLRILKDRSLDTPRGIWVLGRGWSVAQFNGFPHKKILDELFPENPVVLNSHDEHMLWVNSQTLKQAGILAPAKLAGAYFGTDADGSLNGVIGENAIPLIRNHIPKPDFEQRRRLLLQVQKKLHRLGVVGLHSMDANAAFGDLQQLNRKNELRLRVFHSIPIRQLEEAVRIGLKSGLGDSFFRFGLVKIFSDGALGSRTASMLEPYDEAGGTGIETIAEPDLVQKIRLALENGIAVAVHAIGDKANRSVLNAFEQNQPWLGVPGAASRVEHAQLLHPRDVARFGKLGIFASMQPIHAISDQPLAEKFWGDRARCSYAWRALLESQATLLFGSDAPVEDPDPLLGLAAAIERQGWNDKSQTISASDAIAAYTQQPAIAEGHAGERGSIEAGKLADLTILSEDPARTATSNIRVVATIVDGEFVYRDF